MHPQTASILLLRDTLGGLGCIWDTVSQYYSSAQLPPHSHKLPNTEPNHSARTPLLTRTHKLTRYRYTYYLKRRVHFGNVADDTVLYDDELAICTYSLLIWGITTCITAPIWGK